MEAEKDLQTEKRELKRTKGGQWIKGTASPNPTGRPKGIPSIGGDVKESIIRIFQRVDGEDRLVKIMTRKKDGEFTPKAEAAFLSFVKNILVPLLPKKTEFDVEKKVLVLEFSGGTEEKFGVEKEENIFDVESKDICNDREAN